MSLNLPFNFDGKSIVVIGGTSGINLGIAQNFAAAGGKVGVASRSKDKVDAAVESLEELGATAVGATADVRDLDAIQRAFELFGDQLGEIDAVISGAAGNFPAKAIDMSSNGFAAVMNIDLLGTYHVVRTAYSHIVKPGGAVINISAPQSYVPMLLQSHVCAAKAGVDMLTRTLALEWGGDGIRVNSIVPGPIENTEGMKRLAPTEEALNAVIESVPLNRLGTASDIGQTAMFLASPYGEYITGAVIPVDGGWSLGGVTQLMDQFV